MTDFDDEFAHLDRIARRYAAADRQFAEFPFAKAIHEIGVSR